MEQWTIEVKKSTASEWQLVDTFPDTDKGQDDALARFGELTEDVTVMYRITTPEPS